MFDTNNQRTKSRIEVELYLDDGSQYLGKFGLGQSERLSDLMNDERKFLPFETSEGQVIMVRKSIITKVVQLDQHVDATIVSDPFEILGVKREISDADLNQSYRALCAENHPDKLQSSGMSPHFMEMANSRMVRINDAYKRVRSLRENGGQKQAEREGAGQNPPEQRTERQPD